MPTEGPAAGSPRAASVARRDVPTCSLDERLGDVAVRTRAAGWDTCVVVAPNGCVLGLLRSEQLSSDADARVEQAMRPGPSTFRPHVSIAEMAKYMREHDLASAPITRSDGTLLGMLMREDAERVAHEEHAKI